MENLIMVLSILTGASGLIAAIWSIFDTRKKYYQDYLKRKRK